MKTKALYTILSRKWKDGEILFVDKVSFPESKTREAVKVLGTLASVKGFERILSKKNNSALVALSTKSKETERAFANLGNIAVLEARNIDPLSLLEYKYLVVENPEVSVKAFPKIKTNGKQ